MVSTRSRTLKFCLPLQKEGGSEEGETAFFLEEHLYCDITVGLSKALKQGRRKILGGKESKARERENRLLVCEYAIWYGLFLGPLEGGKQRRGLVGAQYFQKRVYVFFFRAFGKEKSFDGLKELEGVEGGTFAGAYGRSNTWRLQTLKVRKRWEGSM